jgi:excinuclease ABC subunit C
MEVITTHTEAEALLLEANLIKRLKPRFNIVLRDDKSYPWLMLTEDHPYPQIAKHRGARLRKGSYWGPFASAWAVNQTVTAMQRVFLLRSCADTVFANRTRPCLLYQIKRCSGPCVGRIEEAEYGKLVAQAKAFLAGKVRHRAAGTRRRDGARRRSAGVRARRRCPRPHPRADVRAGQRRDQPGQPRRRRRDRRLADRRPDLRAGVLRPRRPQQRQPRVLPDPHARRGSAEVLSAFIAQFYDDKPPPPLVLINHELPEQALVAEALTLKAGRKVEIVWCRSAAKSTPWSSTPKSTRARRWNASWPSPPARRSCWKVSRAVRPGCAAGTDRGLRQQPHHGHQRLRRDDRAGPEGFIKAAYRKFAIRGPIAPGDDFAMMRRC